MSGNAATLQEQVVDEARSVLAHLDDARSFYDERNDRATVQRIDFAIGATLSLRSAVDAYDEAVGRG